MEQAGRSARLSLKDRLFLLKTAYLVLMIRVGLWLLPFRTLRRRLEQLSRPRTSTPGQLPKMRIVWAVMLTSRYIPKATCLTQALAAYVLLSRRGFPANLRIGVAKDDLDQLEAHAWVESEGQIVIGGEESSRHYTPFPSLEGKNL